MTNHKIWQSYRSFRRAALTDSKISEYLGAELNAMQQIPASDTSLRPEVLLAQQSLRSLVEVARGAVESLGGILAATPTQVLDVLGELEAGLAQRVPNLDPVVKGEALSILRSYGSPRNYLSVLQLLWSQRLQTYVECERILMSPLETLAQKASSVAEKIGRARRGTIESPNRNSTESLESDVIAKQWAEAKERQRKDALTGATVLADGALKTIALKTTALQPELARELGIRDPDGEDPSFFVCLIFGFGLAVCIIVLLIAASSHNVDEDPEDGTSTGGDDESTGGD